MEANSRARECILVMMYNNHCSYKQMAELAGISYKRMNKIGDNFTLFTEDEIRAIAKVWNMDPEDVASGKCITEEMWFRWYLNYYEDQMIYVTYYKEDEVYKKDEVCKVEFYYSRKDMNSLVDEITRDMDEHLRKEDGTYIKYYGFCNSGCAIMDIST